MKTQFQYIPVTEPHLLRTLRNEYTNLLSSLDNAMDYTTTKYWLNNHDVDCTVNFHYPKDIYTTVDNFMDGYGDIEDITLVGKNAIFDIAGSYFFNSYVHNFKYFNQYKKGYDVDYFIRIKEGLGNESPELKVLRVIVPEESEPVTHVMTLSFRDLADEVLSDVK